MFKVKSKDQPIKWPVSVYTPNNGGTSSKGEFTAHFMMHTRSELEPLIQEGDIAMLRVVLVGWDGISDEDGNAIPFSDEARDQLLDIPYLSTAAARAYMEFMAGGTRKN